MDNGEIVEEGNHKELLKKKGYYYRLWRGQSIEEPDKIISVPLIEQ
ncbi:hypothetical protein CLOBL_51030 [Clostridium sp. BL-8]|nr:hypothetical protein CLOBL_51030 [Clostridium sp. BL-8]